MKNREPYKQAVDLANSLKRDGLIREYAIGGAVAALLYTEPAYTRDLDIFFIPQQAGGILDMSDLFEYVVAVALQTGRHKDIDRVQKVWSQAKELINVTKLKDVLHRYGLGEKFRAATGELP